MEVERESFIFFFYFDVGFPPRKLTFIARELPGTFYSNLRIVSIIRREIGGERKERGRESEQETGRERETERVGERHR